MSDLGIERGSISYPNNCICEIGRVDHPWAMSPTIVESLVPLCPVHVDTTGLKPCVAVPCPPWSDDPPEVWERYFEQVRDAEALFNEQYEREEREALEDK